MHSLSESISDDCNLAPTGTASTLDITYINRDWGRDLTSIKTHITIVTANNTGSKGWSWHLCHYQRLGAALWVTSMAARESESVLLSGIIRVCLHASPFLKVYFQFSMNSYDESAGAIGTPQNATGT